MKTGYVYIIECSDGSYYTGVTSNPQKRLYEHQIGLIKGYTKNKCPVKMIWISNKMDIISVIENEKRVKGWRREKKEALINGEYEILPELFKAYWEKKI